MYVNMYKYIRIFFALLLPIPSLCLGTQFQMEWVFIFLWPGPNIMTFYSTQ